MSGPLSFSANNSYPCIVPPNGPTGTVLPVLTLGVTGPEIIGLLADRFTPPLYNNSNGSYDITTGIFTVPGDIGPRVFDITSNIRPVITFPELGPTVTCSVYVIQNESRRGSLDFIVDPKYPQFVLVGPLNTPLNLRSGDRLSLGMVNNSTATLDLPPGALTFSVSERKI